MMKALDKDGNRTISYAEFFSAQKNQNLAPEAKAALEKVTNFLLKPKEERDKIAIGNKDNIARLIREKEEVSKFIASVLCFILN